MRIRLSYKIFVAFLVTCFMVVALMVGITRFYVARNFENYVTKTALEKLGELTDELAAEYQAHQGWHRIKDDPKIWRKIIRSSLGRQDFGGRRYLPRSPNFEGPMPRPRRTDFEREADGEIRQGAPPPKLHETPFKLARGIALFDEQKNYIAGGPPGISPAKFTLREITVEGQTVGWLGLHRREHLLAHPLVLRFLKQQSQTFYLIGGGILLLAAIVAFLLSKHLLAPIRQLTSGTKALTSLQFDKRINVRPGDELGQLAADFNRMAETLEKYEQLRKQWISDISHELRTPLAILRGEIEAMQDGVREVNPQTLGSLHAEALHIGKIVDDLHELSLADTGTLHLNKKPVNPVQVLKESLNLFRTRLKQAQITIQEDLETDRIVTLMADSDRLAQLYGNLLENTLRYADPPGTLNISLEGNENGLTLVFEDSGPGVPEASVGRLFDRLYRVDASRARSRGGSGLGLSICKTIVESHGGKITAANAPAGGLRIRIEFPLA